LRLFTEVTGSGLGEFFLTAVAVQDAKREHPVIACANDIVAPVADHNCLRWIDMSDIEGVFKKLGLICACAIHLGTKYTLEVEREVEVNDDAFCCSNPYRHCHDLDFAGSAV